MPKLLQALLSVRSLDQRHRYSLTHCGLGRDGKRDHLRLYSTENVKPVCGKQTLGVQRRCLRRSQVALQRSRCQGIGRCHGDSYIRRCLLGFSLLHKLLLRLGCLLSNLWCLLLLLWWRLCLRSLLLLLHLLLLLLLLLRGRLLQRLWLQLMDNLQQNQSGVKTKSRLASLRSAHWSLLVDLMGSKLNSYLNLNPLQGHCAVFLGKAPKSHNVSLHP